MSIIINIDVMLAKRKMSVTELSERVGITMANISILKNGKSSIIEVKGNLTIVTLLHHSLYDHRQNPTTHLSSCAYQNGNTCLVLPFWY